MREELFINGVWVKPSSGEYLNVINPATEEMFHQVAAGTAPDIDKAVQAARDAFDNGPWPNMSAPERAIVLRRMGELIKERSDQLARIEVLDNGKPLAEAEYDVADAADCFIYYADLAEAQARAMPEKIDVPDPSFETVVVQEPLGVIGAIIPWNFPLLMAVWKVAPALAAGCCIVLKPSEITPISALELGDIANEAGLPLGVLNIVTGLGPFAGQSLCDHPMVDKLSFTGSGPTGNKVMHAAAEGIKNVSLELGGKSPFIVFGDADIEAAVEWIMFGIFWNKGEICSATSRVLVERGFYDTLLERLVEEAEKIRIGSGLDDGVLLGPQVSKAQKDKILAAIERGKSEGATVASGGGTPAGFETGYYVQPTILTDMPTDSWVWTEEIFGPVVCILPFDSEAEAIAIANESRFGLAAAVMSKNDERANRVASQLRAGTVWINCSQPAFVTAPWGGYKQSGIGRELGRWALANFQETKQITRYISSDPWGWYLKT